ncbi:MAG: hypothetical protein FJY75_01945 [Candidatus Eisenbacteria bacterium]|uniref:Uncharacterized protein n=1 Tax=Eiseniibacteriota bacterium TaxID=2212470 RepID=A0A938BMW4_UNCEI|nr:hypothetical protein [Candidatus Eisenbacteria bacterium]
MQKRLAELDQVEAQLVRDLGQQARSFAVRTDISHILPRIRPRGADSPQGGQVLALTAPPAAPAAERSLAMAVLDLLSGGGPVLAAQKGASPAPATGPEQDR